MMVGSAMAIKIRENTVFYPNFSKPDNILIYMFSGSYLREFIIIERIIIDVIRVRKARAKGNNLLSFY